MNRDWNVAINMKQVGEGLLQEGFKAGLAPA